MSWLGAMAAGWLLRVALGGGVILLLTSLAVRLTRQPARQQRVGEWGLLAALVLAVVAALPGWWTVPVPASPTTEPLIESLSPSGAEESVEVVASAGLDSPDGLKAEPHQIATPPGTDPEHELGALAALTWWPTTPEPPVGPSPAEQVAATPEPTVAPTFDWADLGLNVLGWVVVAYAAAAAGLLGRWLLGHAAVWWLLRTARPAPVQVQHLFDEMAPAPGRPRLLISDRLRSPISCGLLRPAVVLPLTLCDRPDQLRWVFAHELAHLRRRDLWTCWLFGVGQAVYFYRPWFWWLRGRVRLCQEYLADAAVIDQQAVPADYAEFLLGLGTEPVPLVATGVSGRPSELFRRVKMLLGATRPLERRCPGVWSLAVAGPLIGLAVFVGGVRLSADETPAETASVVIAPPSPAAGEVTMAEPSGAAVVGGLDARVERVEPALAEQLDLPPRTGLVVVEVNPIAAELGVRTHDVLVSVGGRPVPGEPHHLPAFQAKLPASSPLEVVVMRKGRRLTVGSLRLPEPPVSRGTTDPVPNVLTMIIWNGPYFQARHVEGTLSIFVTGVRSDGTVRVTSVVVQDGASVTVSDDVSKVSDSQRGRVRTLLDMAAVK